MTNGMDLLRGETIVLSVGAQLEKISHHCQKVLERKFSCFSSCRGFADCVIYEKPAEVRHSLVDTVQVVGEEAVSLP